MIPRLAGVATALLAAVAPHAVAASAIPPSLDLAYSFDGGIHLMRADGSGDVRLTSPMLAGFDVADDQPAWSPDGSQLAFVRRVEGLETSETTIFVTDGVDERALAGASNAVGPAWSPDGRQIAFTRYVDLGDDFESQIVVAPVDGGPERVLVSRRADERLTTVGQPAWSADGTTIAYTRSRLDREYNFRSAVFTVGVAGGGPRLLVRGAGDPAWSPDGRRLAVSSIRDRNGKWCGSDNCRFMGELYVMNADGSAPVRLTRNRADDSAPSWSPEGRHIVFSSDRNNHQPGGFNTELYAIRPDGSCLTWLTNGAPASGEPAWRPASGAPLDPPCGPTRRRARTRVVPDDIRAVRGDPGVWLGERFRGLLVSSFEAYETRRGNTNLFFRYDDCAHFRARNCPRGLQLQVHSVCSPPPAPGRAFVQRGVLVMDVGIATASVIAGNASVSMYAEAGPGRALPGLLRAAAALRPFTRARRSLPPPGLPVTLLRRLRHTERIHRRAGTIEGAARALDVAASLVRRRLRLARTVDALPRVRALRCERR